MSEKFSLVEVMHRNEPLNSARAHEHTHVCIGFKLYKYKAHLIATTGFSPSTCFRKTLTRYRFKFRKPVNVMVRFRHCENPKHFTIKYIFSGS